MTLSELIPRAYQEEIFDQARRRNIIAALDTGSGKTYIAVLLIKWLASQYTGNEHKIYAFLVPRVPLVEQQRDFLAQQLPLTVRGYYGAIVDQWQHDPVRWAKEFKECDVMVMTPQVFLDAMLHAHWSMSQVSLLVFDEAHHARKNNPYNQILQDFYFQCDVALRPRVFGMTASPVWNPKKPHESLRTLENNMCAKVLGVQENLEELREHSPRPDEIIQEYPLPSRSYPEYPTSLWQRLSALALHSYPDLVHDNTGIRYKVTLAEIGPYGADFYLSSHLVSAISDLKRQHQCEYMVAQNLLVMQDTVQDVTMSDGLPHDLEFMSTDSHISEFSSEILQMEAVLHEFGKTVSFEESVVVSSHWLSPKLQVLVAILLQRRSSSFQGIIFVEQRQVATALAWILPRIPELKGWITSGALVGHGSISRTAEVGSQGMIERKQREILKSFRNGNCNLLVSTSVGEEGLDFQACDLVVRYNKLQNMVGYLQSRGRARRHDSTYIIFVPEGYSIERSKYEQMQQSEPHIREIYQKRNVQQASESDEEETVSPQDLAARSQYKISSTGAVLTYGAAISLLNNLCAIVPRDKYTKVLQPQYSGDFISTVTLPSALPIPRDRLVYRGPLRSTKREAKRAAAFVACKALHRLQVFDDYLLPARKTSGDIIEDADGRTIPKIDAVSEMMDVFVHDPWSPFPEAIVCEVWVYAMLLVDQPEDRVGLVIASQIESLPTVPSGEDYIQFGAPISISISSDELQLLQQFTALGIRWCNTSKSIKDPLACLLTLLRPDGQPDFNSMRRVVETPVESSSNLKHENEGHILLQNKFENGRPFILQQLRDDLTPLSRPIPSEDEDEQYEFETYAELFEHRYGSAKYPVHVPREGPMLLIELFVRNFSSRYRLLPNVVLENGSMNAQKKKQKLVPASICETLLLPEHVLKTFHTLPSVLRRIADIYRAHTAIKLLGLPALQEDLVVEALTLPCATAGFNNQRLETLGDSVLKLAVVVHLYNKYPFRHEGQLDGMRKNSVSNRVLLARGKGVGLEKFLTSEPSAVRKWRPTAGDGKHVDGIWYASRRFARRSIQDCMEALLGVSFLSGGIDMALQTGTALELCFGGTAPWAIRYPLQAQGQVPPLFKILQKDIGYEFRSGHLLVEAFTHPSFACENACYQRLEFLGDALLDLVVLEYLYRKFPEATSGQLTWAKSKAVCAPALATLAAERLSLEKYILANNSGLGQALAKASMEHKKLSYDHIVIEPWRYDPPKALSDIVESLCGAMLVDSGYDYERIKEILWRIMEPLLEVLRPKMPRDPTSELMLSLARRGCQRSKFQKYASEPDKNDQSDAIRFEVHGVIVGSPLHAGSGGLARAKPLLAQRVKANLEDPNSKFYVEKLCNCRRGKNRRASPIPDDIEREKLDDEKEEEFAVLAALELQDVDGVLEVVSEVVSEDDNTDEEERQAAAELDGMIID